MRMKTVPIVLAVLLVTGSVSLSFAALLGVVPGLPNLQYDSNGVTTYTASSTSFTLTASPLTIVFPAPLPPIPRLVNPTGVPPSEVVSIGASISNAGAVLGGIVGDDLIIRGQVDADGNGSIDYAGVLLTGEIVAFGFENTSVVVGGLDRYDFRFTLTGGLLASFFTGKDIGVTVSSEHSDFGGDFGVNFTGGAKGSVGPIPRLNQPPVCSANGPYHAECSGGVTTIMLDGSQSSDPDQDQTLTYSWTTDCPNSSFDNPTSATPVLSIDTSTGCNAEWTCTVSLTVSDGVAEPQTCQAQVTVSDSNSPSIHCPNDLTVECGASTDPSDTGSATASDDCDPAPAVSHVDVETPGDCPQAKSIARTWTATDRCGNTATCVQTITVVDTTAPTITHCADDITVTCQQGTGPAVTGTPSASDNCDAAPTATFEDSSVPGCCPTIGIITRTWTVADHCGNSVTCVQTITVRDTSAPSIQCPPDKTIQCNESKNPSNTGCATANDSCDPHPTISYCDTSCGSCPKVISRKWKATDACGRTATCIQTITVVDNTPPVICCPSDKSIPCGDSTDPCQTGRATATDNCDSCVTITYSDNCGGSGCPRTITRTWKAKDDCGNFSTCTQIITVEGQEPCPLSPGYWKNHRNKWPVDSLVIGGDEYNDTEILYLLSNKLPNGHSANGDVSASLAKFVIAATFDILNGSDPQDIDEDLDAAHDLLDVKPPGSNPTGVWRQRATTLKSHLDTYVNSNPQGCVDDEDTCYNRSGCYQHHRHRRGCQHH